MALDKACWTAATARAVLDGAPWRSKRAEVSTPWSRGWFGEAALTCKSWRVLCWIHGARLDPPTPSKPRSHVEVALHSRSDAGDPRSSLGRRMPGTHAPLQDGPERAGTALAGLSGVTGGRGGWGLSRRVVGVTGGRGGWGLSRRVVGVAVPLARLASSYARSRPTECSTRSRFAATPCWHQRGRELTPPLPSSSAVCLCCPHPQPPTQLIGDSISMGSSGYSLFVQDMLQTSTGGKLASVQHGGGFGRGGQVRARRVPGASPRHAQAGGRATFESEPPSAPCDMSFAAAAVVRVWCAAPDGVLKERRGKGQLLPFLSDVP